jgi:response regulator RpfG family c-di-GMP phosphodiesterase
MSRPRILYVDDQLGNLTVFRASMRRIAEIHTARSGAEALERLAQEEFSIVISDQRMEGLSGSELLGEVHRLYPDTVRILLTAYSDFNAIVSAINVGRIARFVRKPWNREEMRTILNDGCQIYESRRRDRVLSEQVASRMALADFGEQALLLLETLKTEAHHMASLSPDKGQRLIELVGELENMAPTVVQQQAAK